MKHTIRKSKRLAAKRKGARGARRMSVGEALGLPPEQEDATNLAEVHALASARKAARERGGKHGKKHKRKRKKHARARSLTLPTHLQGSETALSARGQRRREATPPKLARAKLSGS